MKLDSNTVCLVTGGVSGLGLATVQSLLALGCKVVMADFNQSEGEKILAQQNSKNLRFVKVDVTNEQSVADLVKFTVSEFGGVHVVVNSAGVASLQLTITSKGDVIDNDEFDRVMKINVMGTVNVCKFAAAAMLKQQPIGEYKERGVLINVASLAGIEGQRGQLAYSTSKGAVIGMTLPLARDFGKFGIRVVTIAPSVIQTPMASMIHPKVTEIIKNATALNRNGLPQEFADCVVGLCMNSYITGEVIRLDGGIRLPHL